MSFYKNILFVLLMIVFITITSSCSNSDFSNFIDKNISSKTDQAKQDISNQVEENISSAVNEKVNSVKSSIESTLDPKLGEIRKNMDNIKETVLVYYNINKKMPIQGKVEAFFDKTFKQMNIQYKLSNDGARVFISYIGSDYKGKIQDIVVDPVKK